MTKPIPVYFFLFDPRLPSIQTIVTKHWRSMAKQDQHLAECFSEPPLTAFRRPKNLRELLIKAKVPSPPNLRPERNIKGMKRCRKGCTACPYVRETKNVKINKKETWQINRKHDCQSFNIIYLIECNIDKCKQRYIGESKRAIQHRLADHRGYIVNNHVDKATGAHFNSPGHSLANMTFTVLEQVKYKDTNYRKEREKYFINKFNTKNTGMNKIN